MNIVFMGTPDFAVSTLDAVYNAGHKISLVVTQPDRPKGRHGEVQKSDVRIQAEKYGIPVITPERIRKEPEAIETLKNCAPDVIVVTAFGQILPQEILDIPKYGCINVHASLLPKYRGASPIQWAVLNGEKESGVTTMMMDAGLDTGDILLQKALPLDAKETGGSLFDKLASLGGELIVETLKQLEEGTLPRTPQDDSVATKVGLFTKTSGQMDWSQDADVLERKIRRLNPWPSAFTFLGGKQLKLWDADVVSQDTVKTDSFTPVAAASYDRNGAADLTQISGRIYSNGKRLIILCGKDALEIRSLQLEGKKRMTTEEFLRGHRFSTGG
jgi:methionyl-tRNA formyltransferase